MFRQWVMSAALLVVGGVASAEPSIDALLARINSDSFEERIAATEELAGATNVDANTLVEKLRSGTLTPEATMRVMEVLRRRFAESPRGAIGIKFAQPSGVDLPRVMETYKTFPACRADLVRVGDEFMEVDGQSLVGLPNQVATDKVMAAIFSRSPGESVRLKIRRPKTPPRIDEFGNIIAAGQGAGGVFIGEIVEVDIPLGRRDQLQGAEEDKLEAIQLQQVPPQQAGAGQVIVQERGAPGQPNRVQNLQNAGQFQGGAVVRQLDGNVLSSAWTAYVRRIGVPVALAPLASDADAPVEWQTPEAGMTIGRPMNRAGGRILAGPVKAGAGTVAGLRSHPDVARNQEVLRDLAAGNGGGPRAVIIERVGGADVIRLGDGVNRIEIQVAGNNLVDQNGVVQPIRGGRARGRLVRTADVEAQIDGAREELAAALARVESELRRLTLERQSAPDDLSTTRLVDERLAELRAQWDALRAQAETVASGVEQRGSAEQPID